MNNSQTTACLLLLSSSLSFWQVGFAADSGAQSLGETLGSTDYFKVSCLGNENGDTDHLNFKVIDNSFSDTNDIPPQVLNAHVFKDNVEIGTLTASSGANDEVALAVGNGKYKLVVDTVGTNTVLKSAQKYTFDFQCKNSEGVITKSSGFKNGSVKSIKNGKIAKYTLKCASNSKVVPQETTNLTLQLINQSSVPIEQWVRYLPVLNAQVTKGRKTLNTSDLAGDSNYSNSIDLQNGNGDYYISVNHTAINNSPNNSKNYSIQYSCMNGASPPLETNTGLLEILQDQ